jgi:hypothetical protein
VTHTTPEETCSSYGLISIQHVGCVRPAFEMPDLEEIVSDLLRLDLALLKAA